MQTRIPSIDSQIQSSTAVEFPNDFALEIAELEMILSMKSEEGLKFASALPSALACSGNEWLFDFPADRFPIPAKHAAAIRICSGDDELVTYVYEKEDGEGFSLVEDDLLDSAYFEFAESYASVAGALEPILAKCRGKDLH